MSDGELSACKVGDKVTMGGVSSWTGTESVAVDFAEKNLSEDYPNVVIYRCETQSKGTGIRHISVFEEEDEILCSTESEYVIDRIEKDENQITYIYLKEV